MTNHVHGPQRQQPTQRPPQPPKPKPKPVEPNPQTDRLARGRNEFITPTKGPITSGFGMRVHPVHGGRRMHNGIDIGAPTGTPIQAAKAGKVVTTGNEPGGAGNYVVLDHGNGVQTKYFHLDKIQVREGQTVEAGQQIGTVGSTGASTGPHLHFEVHINGRPVDPAPLLNGEAPILPPSEEGYSPGGTSSGYVAPASGGGGSGRYSPWQASQDDDGNLGAASKGLSGVSGMNATDRASLLNKLSNYGITEDWLRKLLEEMGVPPEKMDEMMALILAIIMQESGGNANARSPVGAMGLMQLMPATARGLGVNPNDPKDNVRGGVKYILQMLKQFDGDVTKATAAYNAGPGAVQKYGGVPPYAETQNYVKKVLGYANSQNA